MPEKDLSYIEQLRELKRLLDDGIITEDEFEQKKKILLDLWITDMKIDACGATHTGKKRNHNEDNIYVDGTFRNDLLTDNVMIRSVRQSGPYVYGVFDGLGGEACGEQASFMAAVKLRAADRQGTAKNAAAFTASTHQAILSEAAAQDTQHMGTTAAVLIIDGNEFKAFNIGDSRVYLLRGEKLYRLTKDHSVVQTMIDCGFIDEADRRTNPHVGELTQYLGMVSEDDMEPEAHAVQFSISPGDLFILCSDGLTGELTDDEIGETAAAERGKGAEFIVVDLIKRAIDRGGMDNVSVIAVCIE